jgi:Transposase DDE domain/Domain of unknown function (DUF4372)
MSDYNTIFHKFLDFIDWKVLQYSSFKLNTDYKVSKFFTKDHLETMIFYHIKEFSGLRDLRDSVSLSPRLDRLVKSVSLGTLSNHNNKRNFNVFMPVLNALIQKALSSIKVSEAMKKFGPVKLIDSTTISMCMKYFSWALFRENKAGVKMHTKFDLTKGIPQLFIVTNAEEHDRTQMDTLMNERYCIYVFDKGYIDYKKFDEFTKGSKFFITRLKDNAVTKEIQSLEITYSEDRLLNKDIKLISDKLMKLGSMYTYQTKKSYRVIKLIDDKGKELTFVTNILELSTEEIAWLYKKRWEIELFFKWIKQNLKFKKLIGHTFNAVMIQIITGIMTFIMIKLVQENCRKAYGLIKIKRKIRACVNQTVIINLFTWYHWFEFS